MKVYKFLATTIAVTAVALIYVSQQTALVRLSYDIKYKEKSYSELLDRNKILLYNVRQLESPARLEQALLAKKMKLEIPSKERVILVSAGVERSSNVKTAVGIFGKIRQITASLFTLGPEAQARPVVK
jgi:cell division protein FtsL